MLRLRCALHDDAPGPHALPGKRVAFVETCSNNSASSARAALHVQCQLTLWMVTRTTPAIAPSQYWSLLRRTQVQHIRQLVANAADQLCVHADMSGGTSSTMRKRRPTCNFSCSSAGELPADTRANTLCSRACLSCRPCELLHALAPPHALFLHTTSHYCRRANS